METSITELESCLGFTAEDADCIQELGKLLIPQLPRVVEFFYETVLAQPRSKDVFSGAEQINKLRQTMAQWLRELLTGPYDEKYWLSRPRIGYAHVRVSLPQHLMPAGIEVLWRGLQNAAVAVGIPLADPKLRSLHKLLTMELTVMLGAYQDSYAEQVRLMEHSLVEERLTRAEHLAEIGQLAASLAHEIKNPLAGISGAIQIIRDDMSTTNPHYAIVGEILGQIHRLDAAVNDLLFYARPMAPQARECALEDVVTRVLTILKEEPALQNVRLSYDAGMHRAVLLADENQVEQLVINLIINAAHASHDQGQIWVSIHTQPASIRLIVRDCGKGMPPEILQRAFEPFFTTKAKGTGLGLSICKRIVDSHGGRIDLESANGQGTTVTVDLPRLPARSRKDTRSADMLP